MYIETLPVEAEREIKKVVEVAGYLWQREWAERNGGNISLDLTEYFEGVELELSQFAHNPLTIVGDGAGFPKDSAGHVFFVKGTGERIRELREPHLAGCILKIDETAEGYHLLWGGRGDPHFKPTSEFISHVEIMMDKQRSGSNHRCVVHSHPLELIALSHLPKCSSNENNFTEVCWQMLPEVRAFVPQGIGIVPYCMPGSQDIAVGTMEKLRNHDVAIWEKHGAVATGVDVAEAFDFMDVANKGAKLYLMCLSAGFEPQGVSEADMLLLKETFNL
ncbi:rhamnulose-1-phosphate aldolase [Pseudovibrio sp. Tun.PSC04-5.I4]|uniref:rhamnulose-1-phosphate aldolase n=1 Tax=Pseudovibrio sp. Tun.PSC04-5.I4 TaxID=1798213 RepID=UPI0008902E96|nr:rhamnulose-1-phosphate aldolase [Pseudovibrio sp. Tun.PSC04-5.I4]SDQ13026.1 L-rhamnulose 1-phosphate aldolase [Pseudovibrio sp. Tun.PSC04-5.I4]